MVQKRKINFIYVHCSDTPDDMDIRASHIRQWHIKENGWRDIGYHYVICRDGVIEKGRSEATIGAHVKGYNHDSLGVVWCGRTVPTKSQYSALLELVAGLAEKYEIPVENILGHYERDSIKTCPNLNMKTVRVEIKKILDE